MSQPLRRFTVTPRGKQVDLQDEMGISISIPRNATAEEQQMMIGASFAEAYETPGHLDIVSPAYIMETSGKINDVEVKLAHNANLKAVEDHKMMVSQPSW